MIRSEHIVNKIREASFDPKDLRELKLYIDNDPKLFTTVIRSVVRTLRRMVETDKFDLDKASKETMKIVVAGVQRYEKDLGLEGRNFNASLQQQLAMDLARDIERKIRNKEL